MRPSQHRRRLAALTFAVVLGASVTAQGAPAPPPRPAAAKTTPTKAPSAAVNRAPIVNPTRTTHQEPGWWHSTYLIDWGVTLGVAATGAGINVVKPHTRSFTLDSPRIDHAPHADTVPALWLILSSALPLAAFGIAQANNPSWHDFHHASLGLAEAFGATLLATSVLKVSVGRLRPDFLSRCQPDANLQCTGDPAEEREGRLSFPSGHASLSFVGGTYLSLYLWGKLSPLGGLHWLWKVPVLLLPMAAATFVAWTRVHDHRHHWEDVLGGGLIGFGCAALGYLLNFHPPWSKNAGKPRRRKRLTVVPVAGRDRLGLAVQGGF